MRLIILLKEYIKWVIVANIIAWPLAYYFMHRWLEGFAYHINLNILIFLGSGINTFILIGIFNPEIHQVCVRSG